MRIMRSMNSYWERMQANEGRMTVKIFLFYKKQELK